MLLAGNRGGFLFFNEIVCNKCATSVFGFFKTKQVAVLQKIKSYKINGLGAQID
jgi:hypothetical protein